MGFSSIQDAMDWLIETVGRLGIEYVFKRYYGIYRGSVEDVLDPEKRGRVRVRIPVLGHLAAPADIWVVPVFPGYTKGHGYFHPPSVGDQVWLQFENGDRNRPVYMGGFTAIGNAPAEFDSDLALKRGIKTPAGHYIRFSDETDDRHIVISCINGGYISLDNDGNALFSNSTGSHLYLNAAEGQTTLMDQSGAMVSIVDGVVSVIAADGTLITVGDGVQVIAAGDVLLNSGGKVSIKAGTVDIGDGASQAVVLGTSFLTLFNTHTHLSAAPLSPTAPPMIPMVPGTHTSLTVKTA